MKITQKIHLCINYTSETTDRSSLIITKNAVRRRRKWGQKRPQHGICVTTVASFMQNFFFDGWVGDIISYNQL